MKPFFILNVAVMFLALHLAFAGGGSEVGDSHGSRASVPLPYPTPSYPGGGAHLPLPLFNVASVEYSAIELRAGETLTVTIVANAAYNAPSAAHCAAVLKSDDLHGISIPVATCQVSQLEDGRYKLVLVHQFPARTPSREYYVGEVTVNRSAVPLIAAKRFHVHGSATLGDLDMTSTILTTESGTPLVKHGEDFFLDTTFRTDGQVLKVMLQYVVDQGAGIEPKTLSLVTDADFVQQTQEGFALVRIPLMSEVTTLRHIELRRLTVLNSSLQSASFALPEAFVIDFE